MKCVHRARDRRGNKEKDTDLEAFNAINGERAVGREEVEVDEEQGQPSRERARPQPTIPGGDGHCRYEEKKAWRRPIAPKGERRYERYRRRNQRQRVSSGR